MVDDYFRLILFFIHFNVSNTYAFSNCRETLISRWFIGLSCVSSFFHRVVSLLFLSLLIKSIASPGLFFSAYWRHEEYCYCRFLEIVRLNQDEEFLSISVCCCTLVKMGCLQRGIYVCVVGKSSAFELAV